MFDYSDYIISTTTNDNLVEVAEQVESVETCPSDPFIFSI